MNALHNYVTDYIVKKERYELIKEQLYDASFEMDTAFTDLFRHVADEKYQLPESAKTLVSIEKQNYLFTTDTNGNISEIEPAKPIQLK